MNEDKKYGMAAVDTRNWPEHHLDWYERRLMDGMDIHVSDITSLIDVLRRERKRNMWQDIINFHEKFGLKPRQPGKMLPISFIKFRVKRLLEEVDELVKALVRRDMTKALDACVDINYINMGNAYMMGLPFPSGWDEVQRTNMLKERATEAGQSRYGTTADIIKPPGWTAPDLAQFIHPDDRALKLEDDAPGEQHDLINYINEIQGREAHEQDTRGDTAGRTGRGGEDDAGQQDKGSGEPAGG